MVPAMPWTAPGPEELEGNSVEDKVFDETSREPTSQ
jgi:hypothetical protein